MSLEILPRPTAVSPHLAPVESRYTPLFCLALLTTACALASFAFACATPFAAFAVVAAAMLPLGPAVAVVTGAWLVNQMIGFGALHYPVDATTMLWGFVIGLATVAATSVSVLVLRIMRRSVAVLALAAALIGAYCAYELVLFAATPFLGGTGDFTAAIVARLGLLSALWLIGLVAVCEVFRLVNPLRRGRKAA